jgi:hypothetical protein
MLSVIGHSTLHVCKHDSQRSYIRPPKGSGASRTVFRDALASLLGGFQWLKL